MNTALIKGVAVAALSRGGLLLAKYGPQILFGAGIVGGVTATVMACNATLEYEKLKGDAETKIDEVHEARKRYDQEKYPPEAYAKDLSAVYARKALLLVKTYGPAIALGVASIGCLAGSHKMMSRRNLALVAAYNAISESFNFYRNGVKKEFGSEKDRNFLHGVTEEKTIETVKDAETGKKVKIEKTTVSLDRQPSIYGRYFDESSTEWRTDRVHNLHFLTSAQEFMNIKLRAQRHVFLNEVYDQLGIPRSQEGCVVGWVLDGDGDGQIDYGIYDITKGGNRDYINGYGPDAILLDFNVDGVIYDLI